MEWIRSSFLGDSQERMAAPVTLPWPNYFGGGAKSFGKMLPSHFTVTCYPYKEVHVTAKCDGKILTTCHLFCTPGKVVRPRQCETSSSSLPEITGPIYRTRPYMEKDQRKMRNLSQGVCI